MCDKSNIFGRDIFNLTRDESKDWRKLLQLGEELNPNERSILSWVWPTVADLKNLKTVFDALEVKSVLSIGCGNGFFEWILRESTGIPVFGLEVDRSWWQSKYAVKSFIPLNFIDDNHYLEEKTNLLQNCCGVTNWNFALLFCYFNNRPAFLDYLELYDGDYIILIGPNKDVGIYTEPNPLEPQFLDDTRWKLIRQIDLGVYDVVAIYKKC